jgi:hypothetical protein
MNSSCHGALKRRGLFDPTGPVSFPPLARVPWLIDTEREMPAEYEPTADQRALRVKPSSN